LNVQEIWEETEAGQPTLRNQESAVQEDDVQDVQLSPENSVEPSDALGGFNSVAELAEAYTGVEALVRRQSEEMEEMRGLLSQMDTHARDVVKGVNHDSFMNRVRETFDHDPVSAVTEMIKKYQEDALNEMETRFEQRLQDQTDFSRFMNDFLSDPNNSALRPYQSELEFLIRQNNMEPGSAAELVRNIASKGGQTARRRSEMAKAIRNRSVVESAGDVDEPVDHDQEFDRVLKKAKTLDEMFAGLRKLKL
jgi:hypothetical protein